MAWYHDIQNWGIIISGILGVLAIWLSWKNFWGQKDSTHIAKLALKHTKEANRVALLNNFPRVSPRIRRYKNHIEYIMVNEGDVEADDSYLEIDVYNEDEPSLLEKTCMGIIPSMFISGEYGEGPIPKNGNVKLLTSSFEAEPFQEGIIPSSEDWIKNHLRSLLESDNLKLVIVIANDVEGNIYCSCRYFFKNLQIEEPKFTEIEKRNKRLDKRTRRCKNCRAFQLESKDKEMKLDLLKDRQDASAWFFAHDKEK